MNNTPTHLPAGTLLRGDTYRIVRFIAAGGFGCTYEAEHVMLRKRVAIKEFFMQGYCNREADTRHVTVGTQGMHDLVDKYRRKFVDEARALSGLHHDGIVSVSDVFEENGTAYYVMDYVEGQSLAERCKGNPLPEKAAIYYIRQVAEALIYVHDHNRLHLDIKPGNIMIEASGRTVLIDFGVSKQYDAALGENTTTLLGYSPGYAPLEQMEGDVRQFLPATDVYALGATLYFLLTGKTPPSASRRINEDMPPLPAGTSAATRRAVDCAMEIRKKDRPQSVREFVALLDAAVKPTSQPESAAPVRKGKVKAESVSPDKPKKSRKVPMGVLVGIIVVLCTALIVLLSKGNHPTCNTCGKVCGASSNACPYGGNHPKCNTCGQLRENCSYGGNHPTCSSCGKVCGANNNPCPYNGNHPKCSTCGKLQENCPYKGNHPITGTHAGHEWVDLGLSVKWATCNVGASSPTGYGNYYAWGETSTKSSYDEENCKTWERSMSNIRGNANYDAARANWGGSWRLPTRSEYDELDNNCDCQWTTQNGVKGMRFTSKKNGNSVFFPATGWRSGSSANDADEYGGYGGYWSSTPTENGTQSAYMLSFGSGGAGTDWGYRDRGRSVRPVLE